MFLTTPWPPSDEVECALSVLGVAAVVAPPALVVFPVAVRLVVDLMAIVAVGAAGVVELASVRNDAD